jgi:hypothetical protein
MSGDEATTIDPGGLDALLCAADPLPAARAQALLLDDAHDELCQALRAQPGAPVPPARRAARGGRRRWLPRLAVALAVVVVISMAALSLGNPGDDRGTVWAAELVRLAEASPLVLLDAPGWQVDYADEQSAQEGEMHFTTAQQRRAELHWRGGELSMWNRDRAASANVSTTAPVLGTTAHVYQYDGGKPGHQDVTALWGYDGRVLEFRAGVADVAAFKLLLAALKQVDTDTWLTSMPDSVVKTSDRSAVIDEMLQGVTVPPGFDPREIKGATLTKDRYQLGAAVTATVACTWMKRWSDARKRGDRTRMREAITAMATAKDWPILREMSKSGAWTEVLVRFADAMSSGRWYGRPLEGDVDSGLGCPSYGLPLS